MLLQFMHRPPYVTSKLKSTDFLTPAHKSSCEKNKISCKHLVGPSVLKEICTILVQFEQTHAKQVTVTCFLLQWKKKKNGRLQTTATFYLYQMSGNGVSYVIENCRTQFYLYETSISKC